MHILADENFPGDAVTALREHGHDVLWVRTETPGISDREVLARAQAEDRVVITFDKDFGELAIVRGMAHCGILLLVNFRANQQATAALHALNRYATGLLQGHFLPQSVAL